MTTGVGGTEAPPRDGNIPGPEPLRSIRLAAEESRDVEIFQVHLLLGLHTGIVLRLLAERGGAL